MDYVTIKTADLGKAHAIAREMGIVLDRMLGGLKETMKIAGRKAGPRGNHEPRWNEVQRMVFTVALDHA